MALLYLDNPNTLDEMTVMELDGLVAKTNGFLSREHQADGTHGNVTATNVTTGSLTTKQGVYERGRSVAMGDWQAVPFKASDFGGIGAGVTWQVDATGMVVHRFTLIGHTMRYHCVVFNSNVSGTTNELTLALPAGYTIAAETYDMFFLNDAGAGNSPGSAHVIPGEAFIRLVRFDGANWTPTAAHNTYVFVNLTLEVKG